EGFIKGRSLIGTPESCQPFIQQLTDAGVNEVACLIDFVQDFDAVMRSLPYLAQLKQRCSQGIGDFVPIETHPAPEPAYR
ncbi:MAG: hypothetical protein AAGM45_15225, partial [Cyanobacteria bacterium J06588_5]